jgi:hypothetical protein
LCSRATGRSVVRIVSHEKQRVARGRSAVVIALVLVAATTAGCGSRSSASPATPPMRAALHSLVGCLQRAGADTSDVTATRDLQVSGGELGVTFTSFHAYVGIGADHGEAVAAASELDRQITVLQQSGHGVVRGSAVYYFDAPLVPRAGAQLVNACVAGSDVRASAAIVALASALPLVQYPVSLERGVRLRCGSLADGAACTCVYRRAARLFSYQQLDGLGRAWSPRRALGVVAGLLTTCARPRHARL